MRPPRREPALVRPHVVTGGRAHPTRNIFDLVTLVIVASDQMSGLPPEQRRIVELCRGGALSVAEIGGHLGLPASVTKVLLSDLADSGHVVTRVPAHEAPVPQAHLLQEVLDGLRALI